jgi:hypothetical protein
MSPDSGFVIAICVLVLEELPIRNRAASRRRTLKATIGYLGSCSEGLK